MDARASPVRGGLFNESGEQGRQGDRKTAKGKRYSSSYGNARKHAVAKAGVAATATKKSVVKAPAKKAVAQKAVAKA